MGASDMDITAGCSSRFTNTSHNPPAAVVVQNGRKVYGNCAVINNLNITIPQGEIYSLIGSSGCGKSTTLSCIIGLNKFTSGDVWVFGKKPASRDIGIPGKSVGYMPQDYSLYNEFNIVETLTYFGMLNGLTKYEIMNAIVFYTGFLDLPVGNRFLGRLSGGQKRRVSFAVALMHNPELLVLDEPTVGVDALLREKIWDYLVNLTKTRGTTVVITTHYIEETRRSDTIGVMKGGQIISESSPQTLMESQPSLEEAVLKLWRRDEKQNEISKKLAGMYDKYGESRSNVVLTGSSILSRKRSVSEMAVLKADPPNWMNSRTRIKALVKKNALGTLRSYPLLLIMLIVPSAAIFTIILGEGTDPHSLHLGIVNDEIQESSSFNHTCIKLIDQWKDQCNVEYFSCRLIERIPTDKFQLIRYETQQEAEHAVRHGYIWGFIYFPRDYSWEFYERAVTGVQANITNLAKSDVIIRLDESNDIVTRLIRIELYIAFHRFLEKLLADCGYNPEKAAYFLQYKDPPLFGESVASFRDYVIPSAFIALMFYWPIVSTGIRFVQEKRTGTMERCIVSGVHTWEMFVSYTITETFIAFGRIFIAYGMIVGIFEIKIIGSLWLEFGLGLLSSYMGVGAGFLFGSFCTKEIEVALLSMAVFMPNMLMSGICWPLEGMPMIFQKISFFLPCTLACEAMRSLTTRGWEFTHPNVWPGFVSMTIYTLIYFLVAFLVASYRKLK